MVRSLIDFDNEVGPCHLPEMTHTDHPVSFAGVALKHSSDMLPLTVQRHVEEAEIKHHPVTNL